MYRPQYFSKTPDGYSDEPFARPLSSLDPVITINPGQYWIGYPVRMDKDAPQIIRSIFIQGGQQGQTGINLANIQIRIRDTQGHDLTDGFIPVWNYGWGGGVGPTDTGSGRAKPFEPEIYCPPGSVLLFDFFNPSNVPVTI